MSARSFCGIPTLFVKGIMAVYETIEAFVLSTDRQDYWVAKVRSDDQKFARFKMCTSIDYPSSVPWRHRLSHTSSFGRTPVLYIVTEIMHASRIWEVKS